MEQGNNSYVGARSPTVLVQSISLVR